MKTFLFGIIFLSSTFKLNAQTPSHDSILKVNADRYLTNKYGQRFKDKYLSFQFIKDAGISAAFYQVKGKIRVDGKNTLLVYFQYESNQVDTSRYVFDRGQILNCAKGKKCDLFIGIDKAKELAKNVGIPPGDRPWRIRAFNFGKNQIPSWSITSTNYDYNDGHGSGSNAEIDMVSGKVEKGLWMSTP